MSSGKGGFVMEAPGEKTGFIAESSGLTPAQMERIVVAIQKPAAAWMPPATVPIGFGSWWATGPRAGLRARRIGPSW